MIWHELPAGVYSLVEQTPAAVLLESAPPRDDSPGGSQSSRLFLNPDVVLSPHSATEVHACLRQIEDAVSGGQFAAGFMGYECGACFEPTARPHGPAPDPSAARPPNQPLLWFGIYDRCHAWDHCAGRFVEGEPGGLRDMADADPSAGEPGPPSFPLAEPDYAERIAAIHEYIRAGDVYQLNFTFPLRFKAPERIAALYAELRRRQPVKYGALIHWERGRYILSYSPELFFRIDRERESRRITTMPMKGTVRRGRTTAEDLDAAEWLRNDAKNRSENVMIVDLLRNDLGRLCEFGSVETRDLFAVERHPTLWQMTSTVSGVLRQGVSFGEILASLFPSGSVTGAPKVRAMQLISGLEEEPRGVYTGMIGYFSQRESVASVAIRTVEIDTVEADGGNADRTAKMGVGSGIVIDSDAAEEYRECRLKSQFLTERPPRFELIETLRWDGGYPLLELHLDRLEDSARYFDFRFDRAEIRSGLMAAAVAMLGSAPRKVRLLLSRDGGVMIESEPLVAPSGAALRVCIGAGRTDAEDRFYFHKTTNRQLYTRALKSAQQAGFDDVLFLNCDEQVTESAIGNVFIEKDERLWTPPVACGLLGGVFRRHLMETRNDVAERVLRLEDLKAADRVYLSNAVRGLRAVEIDWESAGQVPADLERV
jgi:para-aminobenzoate synthetase / 4-amino-4-deoxychorismate lyase